MTDRENPGGGGLTGATGDLTPDLPDESFESAERREVQGPDRAQVTHRQGSAAPAQQGDVVDPGQPETRIGGDELADDEERF